MQRHGATADTLGRGASPIQSPICTGILSLTGRGHLRAALSTGPSTRSHQPSRTMDDFEREPGAEYGTEMDWR
jgi:hypothetical protein